MKRRELTPIAGRIYLVYRDDVWRDYWMCRYRCPVLSVPEYRTYKYVYVHVESPLKYLSSMDIVAGAWMHALGRGKPPSHGQRYRVAVKFRIGEHRMLREISKLSGVSLGELCEWGVAGAHAAYTRIVSGRKQVARLPSDLLEYTRSRRMHPLYALFAHALLWRLLSQRGVRSGDQV